jgi:integrase
MAQHGQVLRLRPRRADGKALWAYRYRVDGWRSKRPQVGGFATRDEAERALRRDLARRRRGATLTLNELVEEYQRIHQAAPSTIDKLRWLLSKATAAFGEMELGALRSEEICAWRGTLPDGYRFEATQALRQVLNAAVAWELIDVNPARRGVPNPLRRFPEKRPFESWEQINALAAELDATTGPMVLFGAATGLRPAELVALEQRDVDRTGGVVYVRRQLVRGRVKHTKTRRSVRAVPLQAAALEALDQLPASDSRLLFPAPQGGYIDLHNFRARQWRPAQTAAGIDPIRTPYDLRHTYATFALRAGISIFDLSRFMGASLAMIDKHYGHLARDGWDHAVALLDAQARDSAAWTSNGHRARTRKPARRQPLHRR